MEDAVAHARTMAGDGADFIDIGAQSTRPGARRLSTEEELSRLLPVLEALVAEPAMEGVRLSVDTFDARYVSIMICIGSVQVAQLMVFWSKKILSKHCHKERYSTHKSTDSPVVGPSHVVVT